jgi:hypothetical protein
MVRSVAIAGAACVNLAAVRRVSNHGSRFGLAAILRDALASLGLLRMRSEWWKDSRLLRMRRSNILHWTAAAGKIDRAQEFFETTALVADSSA